MQLSPTAAAQQAGAAGAPSPGPANLDGHAGAVEALREQHVVAAQAVVCGRKLQLGQGEGVSQVEHTVHVWVGEGAKELGRPTLSGGVRLKGLGRLPLCLRGEVAGQPPVGTCADARASVRRCSRRTDAWLAADGT